MSFIGKLFGGSTNREQRLDTTYQNAFLPITQQGSQYSKEYHDLAAPMIQQAGDATHEVGSYFSDIMKGGPAMMSALAPELSKEATAYKNISDSNQFAPRGAGQISRQAGLDTQHLASIADIVQKARPMAAQGLAGIAQMLYGAGQNQEQLSLGEQGTIGGLLNQFRTSNLQEKQMRLQSISQLVGAIGGVVGAFA